MSAHARQPAASAATPSLERPIVTVLIGFAAGLLFSRSVVLDLQAWLLLLLALGGASLLGLLLVREAPRLNWLCVLVVCFALGGGYYQFRERALGWNRVRVAPDSRDFAAFRVRGIVLDVPSRVCLPPDPIGAAGSYGPAQAPEFRMTLDVRSFENCRIDSSARPGPVRSRCRLNVVFAAREPVVFPGECVEVLGFFSPARPASNPGEMDYADFAIRRGIVGTLAVPSVAGIRRVAHADAGPGRWGLLPARFGSYIRSRIRFLNHGREIPLANSLLLGDRRSIPYETRDAFMRSGTMHYIAISGFHLAVAALILWVCLTVFMVPHRARLALTLVGIWFYTLVSGVHEPTVRAAVMVTAFLAAPLLGRTSDPASSFACAILAVLVMRPAQIESIGFHLSVLAVWAIVYLFPLVKSALLPLWGTPWQEGRRGMKVGGWPLKFGETADLVLLPCLIWLVLAPYIAGRFHIVTPVAPLATLLLAPLLPLFLFVGFLGFVLLPVSDVLGWLTIRALDRLDGAITWVTMHTADLAMSHYYVAGPGIAMLLLFYAWVILWPVRARLRLSRPGLWAMGLLILSLAFVDAARARGAWDRKAVLADVGHGLCFVSFYGGNTIVYDAGSSSVSRGANALSSILWEARRRRIDWLVLSHADSDHCNAVPQLLRRFTISNLLVSPAFERRPAGRLVRDLCLKHGVRVHVVKKGNRLKGRPLAMTFLHPDRAFLNQEKVAPNDLSLVGQLRLPGIEYILTGDLEDTGAACVVGVLGRMPAGNAGVARVLCLPHHGEPLAIIPDLVKVVGPAVALTSGRDRFRAPPRSCRFLSTGEDGAIIMNRDGRELVVETFRSARRFRIPIGKRE